MPTISLIVKMKNIMNLTERTFSASNVKKTIFRSVKYVALTLAMAAPLVFAVNPVSAQTQGTSANSLNVRESVEELRKGESYPAFSITVDYPAAILEEAVNNRLKADHLSGKKSKGVMEYRQVVYPSISPSKMDIFTKVVGDKSGSSSTLYFFVSKGYENFVTSNNDAVTADNIKRFLSGLHPDIHRHHINTRIAEQDKVVKKVQKEYDKLVQQQQKLNMEVDAKLQTLNSEKGILDGLMLEQADIKK